MAYSGTEMLGSVASATRGRSTTTLGRDYDGGPLCGAEFVAVYRFIAVFPSFHMTDITFYAAGE